MLLTFWALLSLACLQLPLLFFVLFAYWDPLIVFDNLHFWVQWLVLDHLKLPLVLLILEITLILDLLLYPLQLAIHLIPFLFDLVLLFILEQIDCLNHNEIMPVDRVSLIVKDLILKVQSLLIDI